MMMSSPVRLLESTELEAVQGDEGFLGRGGFGEVRLCFHRVLGAVAVKRIQFRGSSQEIEQNRKRLKKELDAICSVNHDNVVRLHGIIQWDDDVGLVLEYLSGRNLCDFLKCAAIIRIAVALRFRICYDVAHGLCYLHNLEVGAGMSHGDLKPQNILLNGQLRCKITDFGSATLFGCSGHASCSSTVSPFTHFYCPPERRSNLKLKPTPVTDAYGYGKVVWDVLTRYRHDLSDAEIEAVLRELKGGEDGGAQDLVDYLHRVASAACSDAPADRPTMLSIRDEMLHQLRDVDTGKIEDEVAAIKTVYDVRAPSRRDFHCAALDQRYYGHGRPLATSSSVDGSVTTEASDKITFSRELFVEVSDGAGTEPAETESSSSEQQSTTSVVESVFSQCELPSPSTRRRSATFVGQTEDSDIVVPTHLLTFDAYGSVRNYVIDPNSPPSLRSLNISSHPQVRHLQHEMQTSQSTSNLVNPLLQRYRLPQMSPSLCSLILQDVRLSTIDIQHLFCLHNLRHLDISCMQHASSEPSGVTVWAIIEALPKLTSLDVSATSIGNKLFTSGRNVGSGKVLLDQTVKRRLNFIGLFQAKGCQVFDISALARKVTGYNTETQIVQSLRSYSHQPERLMISFRRLEELNQITMTYQLCEIVLRAAIAHPYELLLTKACENLLKYMSSNASERLNVEQSRKILTSAQDDLETQLSNREVVLVILLIVSQVKFSPDTVNGNENVLNVLIEVAETFQDDSAISCTAFDLACRIGIVARTTLQHAEKIKITRSVLEISRRKTIAKQNDVVLAQALKFLAEFSFEQQEISREIVTFGGLVTIKECFRSAANNDETNGSILDCLRNIADNKDCRCFLLADDILGRVREILLEQQRQKRTDLAFSCCCVLAFLLVVNREKWAYVQQHCFNDAKRLLNEGIENFYQSRKVSVPRLNSFTSLLELLESESVEVINFAVWALNQYAKKDERYAKVMESEGASMKLKKVLSRTDLKDRNNASMLVNFLDILSEAPLENDPKLTSPTTPSNGANNKTKSFFKFGSKRRSKTLSTSVSTSSLPI